MSPTCVDRSGGKAEVLVHETDFARHARLQQDAVAATDHAHHVEAVDGGRGCCHPLDAACRPDDALERAVVCLDDIVEIL